MARVVVTSPILDVAVLSYVLHEMSNLTLLKFNEPHYYYLAQLILILNYLLLPLSLTRPTQPSIPSGSVN